MTASPDSTSPGWYIIRQAEGQCDIVPAGDPAIAATDPTDTNAPDQPSAKIWGPFASQPEAIARRVGLIRSGHCQPQ